MFYIGELLSQYVLNLLAWSIDSITKIFLIDILSCYLCKVGDKKKWMW